MSVWRIYQTDNRIPSSRPASAVPRARAVPDEGPPRPLQSGRDPSRDPGRMIKSDHGDPTIERMGQSDVTESLFKKGLGIRREVVGAQYVDEAMERAEADDFSRDFQHLVTEYCWGAGWGRDALSRRERSLLNLGMLGALNRGPEFRLHLKGAIRNGCSKEEIKDTLIQLAIYAGIPAGVEAFRLAAEVFEEMEPAS